MLVGEARQADDPLSQRSPGYQGEKDVQPGVDECSHREDDHELHEPTTLTAREQIASKEGIQGNEHDSDAYLALQAREPHGGHPQKQECEPQIDAPLLVVGEAAVHDGVEPGNDARPAGAVGAGVEALTPRLGVPDGIGDAPLIQGRKSNEYQVKRGKGKDGAEPGIEQVLPQPTEHADRRRWRRLTRLRCEDDNVGGR